MCRRVSIHPQPIHPYLHTCNRQVRNLPWEEGGEAFLGCVRHSMYLPR